MRIKEKQRIFKLLKELPNVKCGTEIKLSRSGIMYCCEDNNRHQASFQRRLIENNPTWFEEVLPPKEPVQERLKVKSVLLTDEYNKEGVQMYKLSLSRPLVEMEVYKIRTAIESVLNNDADTVVGVSDINFDKQVLNPHPTGTARYTNWEQGFLVAANKYTKLKSDTVVEDNVKNFGVFSAPPLIKMYTQSQVDVIRENAELAFFRAGYQYLRSQNASITPYDEAAELTVLEAYNYFKHTLSPAPTVDKVENTIDAFLGVNNQVTDKVERDWEVEVYGNCGKEIKSVRRLSDGVMFSVDGNDKFGGKILKFEIVGNEMKVQVENYGGRLFLSELKPTTIDKPVGCTCKVGEPYNNLTCPIHGNLNSTVGMAIHSGDTIKTDNSDAPQYLGDI